MKFMNQYVGNSSGSAGQGDDYTKYMSQYVGNSSGSAGQGGDYMKFMNHQGGNSSGSAGQGGCEQYMNKNLEFAYSILSMLARLLYYGLLVDAAVFLMRFLP